MIVVMAQYFGRPETAGSVGPALQRMAHLVRAREPGCRAYQVSQAVDVPDDWLLYEVYTNQEALTSHRESEHFKEIILGKVVPLLERRVPRVYELVVP